MNLKALYDLKERLEYSAIAGTGLLKEDFRLKRTVDNLAPLASASPVFAKISASAGKLLEASEKELSKQLLDVLSLVDAVIYTQGKIGIDGEILPINSEQFENSEYSKNSERNTSGKYVQASYLQLQPLIVALTATGSGRMAVIQERKSMHPEFFEDFRVLPLVINALGDSYAEIPELIYEILRTQGKKIVPLLKDGFEPCGKKDMVRRAMLIRELAGVDENDWYIKILPETQKEILEIIIKALGEDSNNEKLILELYNTEKGKAKEAVLYALAKINSQDGKYTPLELSHLIDFQNVLVGKYSAQIYDLWIWIAEQLLFTQTSHIKNVPMYLENSIITDKKIA